MSTGTSLLAEITPAVITFNEEPNIARTLERLGWAREVVVIDSGSTDRTLEIVRSFPNTRILPSTFETFSGQWNLALEHITTEWALTLDADYLISKALVDELQSLQPPVEVAGYEAGFVYCNLGRPLTASMYPPRIVLLRRGKGAFYEEGHQQKLRLTGRTGRLQGHVYHDDRKPLSRWLAAQERYATIEARRLLETDPRELDWMDRLRRYGGLSPLLVAGYCLLVRGGWRDGTPGLHYALQRAVAEAVLALKLWERRTQQS